MEYYASRTGTRRQLAAFKRYNWKLLVSARGVLNAHGFPFALDNGAWTAYTRHEPFDSESFLRALEWADGQEEWVVCPDAVGDADRTKQMIDCWLPRLHRHVVLVAVQDGMTTADVPAECRGVFVGGTTAWKTKTISYWAQWARSANRACHVGRVNTRTRIRQCLWAGATSADGSGVSRFAAHADKMNAWIKEYHCQPQLSF